MIAFCAVQSVSLKFAKPASTGSTGRMLAVGIDQKRITIPIVRVLRWKMNNVTR